MQSSFTEQHAADKPHEIQVLSCFFFLFAIDKTAIKNMINKIKVVYCRSAKTVVKLI